MALAPLVEGWRRQATPRLALPIARASSGEIVGTFPTDNLPLRVELLLGGAWTDITGYVYYRDQIKITHGRTDEQSSSNPSRCQLALDNRDGRFSPRNANGAWYGLIGRNTQLRIFLLDPLASWVREYRFYGEVSEWPTMWDPTGTDVYAQITASGVRRRLGAGNSPLKSAYYRAATGSSTPLGGLIGYWPMEDSVGSSSFASALPGSIGKPMTWSTSPTLATDTSFACSAALPTLGTAYLSGPVSPGSIFAGEIRVSALMKIPAGTVNGAVLFGFTCSGTAARWELSYGTGGTLTLRAYDSGGTTLLTSGVIAFALDDTAVRLSISVIWDGVDTAYTFSKITPGEIVGGFGAGTLAGESVLQCLSVYLARNKNLTDVVAGHVTAQNLVGSIFENYLPLGAYVGEDAGTRFERLCSEEGITGVAYDRTAPSVPLSYNYMGTQSRRDLLAVLTECELTDRGILHDMRDRFGVKLRLAYGLQARPVDLTLDYSAADLSSIAPIEDDQNLVNDVTAVRTDGSSYRYAISDGTLGTATVGLYDTSVDLSLYRDTDLGDQASWRANLGTVDQPRFPDLSVDLARQNFVVSGPLSAAIRALDIGDRVKISNPPSWMEADDIDQLVVGMSEVLDQRTRKISLVCAPNELWRTASYGTARYESAGTYLSSGLDPTTTSVAVSIPTGPGWGVADGSYDVVVSGEAMTVTAVAGTAPTQTLTVTRSANGIVKSHAGGAEVKLRRRYYYGWRYV
jgi:hypothetical protein